MQAPRSTTCEAMQAYAIVSNIIVISISQLRSDAIIVSQAGIRTTRLQILYAEIWIGK